MTSSAASNSVGMVAALLLRCVLGLGLLITSLTQHVTSQGSKDTTMTPIYFTPTPVAFASQGTVYDVRVTSSTDQLPPTVNKQSLGNRSESVRVADDSFDLVESNRSSTLSSPLPSSSRSPPLNGETQQRTTDDESFKSQLKPVHYELVPDSEDNIYNYPDQGDTESWDNSREEDNDNEDANENEENAGDVTDNEYGEEMRDDVIPHYDYSEYSARGRDVPFNYSTDEDDISLRRLITSGSYSSKGEPINMSLLVIYSWLSLVFVMVVITVVIYKYKEPMNNVWHSLHVALCHRNKRSRGIEESNTLLTHPLV